MSNQATTPRTREELINRFTWNFGGGGLGTFANAAVWDSDRPGPGRPDLPSTVFLTGAPAKYTDEELAQLAEFADLKDARYDAHFLWRRGCNAVVFDKIVDCGEPVWFRKRLTWQDGTMLSKTLDEAIAIFTWDWHSEHWASAAVAIKT